MKLNTPVSLRLTAWYSLMLLISLSLFGALSYFFIYRELYDEQYSVLSESAEQISEIMRLKNDQLDTDHLMRETDEELNLTESGIFFEVWNNKLERIYHSPNFPKFLKTYPPSIGADGSTRIKDQYGVIFHLVTVPVSLISDSEKDQIVFYIRIGQSVLYVERILRRIRDFIFWLTPGILFLAGLGGWILARRVLKPVSEITEAARDISMHHLDMRLPAPVQNDELGQLIRTFNGMIERIQVGVRKIRQFTADASHELRTPLTVMKGEMEVALRRPRKKETYIQVLKSGLQELEWMEKIVDDLLTLSRADAGEIIMEQRWVNIVPVVREVLHFHRNQAQEKHIAISFDAKSYDIKCFIDPDRIRQVVSNLIDNGLKYTPEEGEIHVKLFKKENTVELVVQDTGIGIPAEDLPFVFDRFYRVDKARSRTQRSSGLGLAICKWIVEAHGGQIKINSVVQKGTTVNVRLPLSTSILAEKNAQNNL